MTTSSISSETPQPAPVPRLLVELPSRADVFLENLRDIVSPPHLPHLELQSAPAPFWSDVFVKRGLPWRRFLDSGAYHLVACLLIVGLGRFFALQPHAIPRSALDRKDVISYQAAEYLPPLDTRSPRAARTRKADPELSRQPVISVPAEADNRSQTIVAPPSVKLKRDVAMPNVVAWSDKTEKPQLAIPPAPLTLAAELNRIAPRASLDRQVVAAPPEAAHLDDRHRQRTLQSSVIAPPPTDLNDLRQTPASTFQGASVITPPPSVEMATVRPIGNLNIGRSAVIAPAPQLAVSEQRTVRGGRSSAIGGVSSSVVAPPPALSAGSGASFGARGRVVALNLHPAVSAPPEAPTGNRRGTFAATPEGHVGASGTVGSTSSASAEGAGSNRKSDLPAGLYVGNAPAKTSAAASGAVHSMSATSASSRAQSSERNAKLSDAEKEVFGNRKFYSVTLNMPNLNSAGGSWVIHFAELNREQPERGASRDPNAPPADLSQPAATRKVDPAYPLQLMRENVAGTVILYAVIHADGTVGSVRVLRGVDDRLDQFASEAVAQWKFQPATKNGTPVDVEATFQIPFRPPRMGTNF